MSTQVLQVVCCNLRRKVAHPLPAGEVHLLLQNHATWEVVTSTGDCFRDARILHAAGFCGATIRDSEDMAKDQIYRSNRVDNPPAHPVI